MAYAVTHVLIPIVILDLLRHYVFGKKKFPRYLIVVGGIAGLIPDIDIPLGWLMSGLSGTTISFHGAFTHSFFWVLLFGGTALASYSFQKERWAKIFAVVSLGWLAHIVLDCFYQESFRKLLFWPFSWQASFCPDWNLYAYATSIDAILLVLWLVHEEVHGYVKDYF